MARKGKRERDALKVLKAGQRELVRQNLANPAAPILLQAVRRRDGSHTMAPAFGASSSDADRYRGKVHCGFRDPQNIQGSHATGRGPTRSRWAVS